MEEVRAQPLGQREDVLPVRNIVEDLLLDPLAPDEQPLGVAGRAQVAALAAEGDEESASAARTVDAKEAVLEQSAVEKALDDLGHPGAETAVGLPEPLVPCQITATFRCSRSRTNARHENVDAHLNGPGESRTRSRWSRDRPPAHRPRHLQRT